MKTTKKKNGKRPKQKRKTNQSTKINLIGCVTIVNSPRYCLLFYAVVVVASYVNLVINSPFTNLGLFWVNIGCVNFLSSGFQLFCGENLSLRYKNRNT